jgi:hypothetical protein
MLRERHPGRAHPDELFRLACEISRAEGRASGVYVESGNQRSATCSQNFSRSALTWRTPIGGRPGERPSASASARLARVCTHDRALAPCGSACHLPRRHRGRWSAIAKDINRRIAAEISWSRTVDRSARTRPARQAFLRRFEREVDPDGKLSREERQRRAEHAKRAYMLRLAKRAVAIRKAG